MVNINDKPVEWNEGMTVSSLLEKCRYTFPLIIVKINGQLIPRREFDEHPVSDGDRVEAIHLMSGG